MPESVYISSTFNDLKQFRQAIVDCLVSLGDYYKPVCMEFYDAADVHFVKKCLDDVEACNIYILILGKRYGYIPKGYTKSITEMEYEKARDCQRAGKLKEVLVFKVGDLCNTYSYKENDQDFVAYQQDFLAEVNERLSPKPFESEAELALQVSHALMKRLFKLVRMGEKIIPPDKDATLCYCDRNAPITSLKTNVLLRKKKIFFVQGNRKTDFPGGIVKRFAKYSLGSYNKIEPLIKITDLITSNDAESNQVSSFWNILEYLNLSPDESNTSFPGFLDELSRMKATKVILPFYYDFTFEEDAAKLTSFVDFAEMLFAEYDKTPRSFQLFFITIIYSDRPDYTAIQEILKNFPLVNKLSAFIDKLQPVPEGDIIDWIEKFITPIEFSSSLYNEYFKDQLKPSYNMQDVNIVLAQIIEDLGEGTPTIQKFL